MQQATAAPWDSRAKYAVSQRELKKEGGEASEKTKKKKGKEIDDHTYV